MKLSDEQKQKMYEYGIPERMHDGIIRFYENGIPPGQFLTAIIENDLRTACGFADDENKSIIHKYVMWFYNQAPCDSWGFEGALDRWCNHIRHGHPL